MNREQELTAAGRAALIQLLQRYADRALIVSLIEVQKLMYFLQDAGEPFELRYVKGRYGPYADNLRHVLSRLEGHHLVGFGDGSVPVQEAERIRLLPAPPRRPRMHLPAIPKQLPASAGY